MKLNDLFTRNVITARPDDSLAVVCGKMQEHNVGTVVITEDRRPVGIITDRDVALALGARGISPRAPAEEVMTRHVVAIPADAGIYTATKFIRDTGVRRLPIVDGEDRLVGVLSADDLVRVLATELSSLADGIRHEMAVK